MSRQKLTSFLNAVRENKPGFLLLQKPNHKHRQLRFHGNQDLLEKFDDFEVEQNVYFSVANFDDKQLKRTATAAKTLKSFLLDIDCGESKSYADKKAALSSLKAFCKASKLPQPSFIVDSGNGLHCYWCFETAINLSEWLTAAEELKSLCKAADFYADHVVTSDAARVMRLPYTTNCKQGTPSSLAKISYPKRDEPKLYPAVKLIEAIHNALGRVGQNAVNTMVRPISATTHQLAGFQLPQEIPEGTRNATLLQCAGSLRAIGHSQQEINEALLKLNKSACCPPLNDDEVLSVAQRYESNQLQQDGQVLFSGHPTPDSNDIPQEILEVNQRFAWDRNKLDLYDIENGHYVQASSFRTQYGNRHINIGSLQKPKMMSLGAFWLAHRHRRETPGLKMSPGQPSVLPDGSINLWRGFTCEPVDGDVSPFTDLLERLVPDDDDRLYVLNWLATLIQKPSAKFNVALVVWSAQQGTGKSLLFETVGSLFDPRHFDVVGQEVFSDAFTGWQAHKLMVICDEVSSTRSHSDRIKGWVTANANKVNVKYEPAYDQPNFIKYVFLSNHADAVFISSSDRRFFVVEACSQKLPQDQADAFVRWRDGQGRAALLHFLSTFDVQGFNPAAPAPISNAKRAMIDDNKSDLERWLEGYISVLCEHNVNLFSPEDLAGQYRFETNKNCTAVAVNRFLKAHGFMSLTKQARFFHRRKRLFASQNVHHYEQLTDSKLAAAYDTEWQRYRQLSQS